jgi:hypothetical protein
MMACANVLAKDVVRMIMGVTIKFNGLTSRLFRKNGILASPKSLKLHSTHSRSSLSQPPSLPPDLSVRNADVQVQAGNINCAPGSGYALAESFR